MLHASIRISVLILVLQHAGVQAAPAPVLPDARTRVLDYVERMGRLGHSGAVLIAHGDAILVKKAFGYSDPERLAPMTLANTFQIASVSKQFTATAILLLESQGHLRTTDTLGTFFPEAPSSFGGIALHQLLTHTSGIEDDYDLYSRHPHLSRAEFLNALFTRPLANAPGAEWHYSNDGYALLALCVERVSGSSFQEFVRKNLFLPAHMTRTGFIGDLPVGRSPSLCRSYGGDRFEATADNWSGALGSGDVVSTVEDLFRWELALRHHRVLVATQTAKLTDRAETAIAGMKYGYGWWVSSTERNTRYVFHSGSAMRGVSNAWYGRYPDEDVTIIFLSNEATDGYLMRELFNSYRGGGVLGRIVFGGPVIRPPWTMQNQNAEQWAGRYDLTPRAWFQVAADPRGLSVIPHGQAAFDAVSPVPADTALYTALRIKLPLSPERLRQLSQLTTKAAGIMNGMARGDLKPLRAATEDSTSDILDIDIKNIQTMEMLGTAPLHETAKDPDAVSYARIVTGGQEWIYRLCWAGDSIGSWFASTEPPLPYFKQLSPGLFANFHPILEASTRLQFDREGMHIVRGSSSMLVRRAK